MREYYTQSGKNKGIHYIFDSTTEAITYLSNDLSDKNVNEQDLSNPLQAFPHWWLGKTGDWVKLDDGCVCQVLATFDFKRKRKGVVVTYKDGSEIKYYAIRLCFGAFVKYRKADGSLSNCKVIVGDALSRRESRNGRFTKEFHYLGKFATNRKKLFAWYVSQNGNPIESLSMVQKQYGLSKVSPLQLKGSIHKLAVMLLADPFVIDCIKKYTTDMESLQERVKKALETNNAGVNEAVEAIVSVMSSSKPGLAKLQAAKDILNLHRFAEEKGVNLDGTIDKERQSIQDNISPVLPPVPVKNGFTQTSFEKNLQAVVRDSMVPESVDDILPPE